MRIILYCYIWLFQILSVLNLFLESFPLEHAWKKKMTIKQVRYYYCCCLNMTNSIVYKWCTEYFQCESFCFKPKCMPLNGISFVIYVCIQLYVESNAILWINVKYWPETIFHQINLLSSIIYISIFSNFMCS